MKIRYLHIILLAVIALSVSCSTQKTSDKTVIHRGGMPSLTDEEQTKFNYFFLESVRQSGLGHNTAAFELLNHCREINPDAPEVNFLSAKYFIGLQDTVRAQQCLEKATEGDPTNTNYLEELAQFYTRFGQYSKAINTFERLYTVHPERKDVLETLFTLYQQQNDNTNSLRILDLMEKAEGKNERLSLAKFHIYLGTNPKKAFTEIETLVQQHPNDYRYQSLLGGLQIDNHREKEGLETLGKVLKEDPENGQANMTMLLYYKHRNDSAYQKMLGKVLTNKNIEAEQKAYLMHDVVSENEQKGGDSTQVLSLFREVMECNPDDADMAKLFVSYMSLKKMPVDSIKPVLYKILEVQPDNAGARLQLISYAWTNKDNDEVIKLCEPATQYNPEEMAFYYYKGVAYYQRGDNDKALDAFQRVLGEITPQSDPAIVSDFYAVMGDILHEKGKAKEAYAAYDSCLQWKDDNVGALNNYAYYLSEKGENLERAEQMSYKTIKAEPKNYTFLDTYAWILFMEKRYADAKTYIEEALRQDANVGAVIMEHAGDINAMNGDMTRALECWNKALKDGSTSKTIKRKIKFKKYIE
jgi:tetratricopeptide (TPR) repeat protein